MQVNETILKEIVDELLCGSKVYLHRDTGEIIAIPEIEDFMGLEDPWKEDRKKIKAARGKYLVFEQMKSWESFKIMEEFIDQLDNRRMADRLAIAIQKKRPFAHFNAEISDSGPYREQWFIFREQRYIEWVRGEWKGRI
jgi:uncharacterized radical SAM superfamily Fe-S cluster-containing enzyme